MGWIKLTLGAVALLAIGFFAGTRWSGADDAASTESIVMPQAQTQAPAVVDPHADLPPAFAEHLQARNWQGLVELLETARFNEGSGDVEPTFEKMYERMLKVAAEFGDQDAPGTGANLLSAYVELNPYDERVLFLLADLRKADADYPRALAAAFGILEFPLTTEVAERAARLRDEIIVAQLEELSAVPLPEQVEFLESLVAREPTNDQHRLRLAELLIAIEDQSGAQQALDAIGGFGVSATDVAKVRRQLRLAQAGVPIERIGNSLYAEVQVNGESLRLLVDTGATKTVLETASLDLVSGRRLNRVARLLTAGGPVTAELFQIQQLQFGSLALPEFEVVALPSIPDGPDGQGQTDGLLGMDLLTQVDGLTLP